MSEDRATRWRRMSRKQRERLMSAVAAIQDKRLGELAGEVLAEVLSLDNGNSVASAGPPGIACGTGVTASNGGTTWLKDT